MGKVLGTTGKRIKPHLRYKGAIYFLPDEYVECFDGAQYFAGPKEPTKKVDEEWLAVV